ncbi:hypothetical protein IP84_17015 [beta proteobacterium AAP99]|nr:hypothetical protein IP84_17015 [beta proteobacterium AAP99]
MKHAFGHFIRLLAPEESQASTGPSSYGSVGEAVAELERRERERTQPARDAKAAKAEEAEQPEAEEAEEYEEEASSPAPEEADADDEDVATEEEAEQEPEEQEPSLEDVEYEGKSYKLPPELKNALLRQADYTRKTQEVAQERSILQGQRQEVAQYAQQLAQTQAVLAQFASSFIGEPPPLELAQADIQAYTLQKAMYEQRVQQFQALQGQGQQLTQQQQAMHMQAMQEFQQRELQTLVEKMPELATNEGYQKFATKAVEVGSKYGFAPQEIASITDHRMILALRDLGNLQAETAKRKEIAGDVRKKLANVPPKVAKPGPATNQTGRTERAAQAKQRFMKSARDDRALRRWAAETADE